MRLVVDRNMLLRALGHITGIVERRNTIPILGNILIGADEAGSLTLKATDLDIEAVETVSAKVEQAGAVTITAHTLHDIVRKLGERETAVHERGGDHSRHDEIGVNVDGERLESEEFPAPAQGGIRLMLVATDQVLLFLLGIDLLSITTMLRIVAHFLPGRALSPAARRLP